MDEYEEQQDLENAQAAYWSALEYEEKIKHFSSCCKTAYQMGRADRVMESAQADLKHFNDHFPTWKGKERQEAQDVPF